MRSAVRLLSHVGGGPSSGGFSAALIAWNRRRVFVDMDLLAEVVAAAGAGAGADGVIMSAETKGSSGEHPAQWTCS